MKDIVKYSKTDEPGQKTRSVLTTETSAQIQGIDNTITKYIHLHNIILYWVIGIST